MEVSLRLEGGRVSSILKIINSYFFTFQDSEREDNVRKWKSYYKCTSDWAISNDPDEEEMGNVLQDPREG